MLPGFRFLFAAIVLSMSVLVFGLGAAALLRAAHEEFASTPPWHAAPETNFVLQGEATRPVLALLRVEPPVAEKTPDQGLAPVVPAEPASIAATPVEPARIVALQPEDTSPPETAKLQIPIAEVPPQGEALAASTEVPAPASDGKIAAAALATEPAPPAASEPAPPEASEPALPAADVVAPTAPEPAAAPVAVEADIATTTIATLGGPSVTIAPSGQASSTNPDPNIVRKRLQAQRAIKRRRIASRARLAAQASQSPNPFAPRATAVPGR
jgi:hypothetical protein